LYWKRRPVAPEDYRSQDEMLTYVAGANHKKPLLVRLAVMRECLRGVQHTNLTLPVRHQLTRDTLRIYLKKRLWLIDLKEHIALRIGRNQYRKWLQIKAVLSSKPSGL